MEKAKTPNFILRGERNPSKLSWDGSFEQSRGPQAASLDESALGQLACRGIHWVSSWGSGTRRTWDLGRMVQRKKKAGTVGAPREGGSAQSQGRGGPGRRRPWPQHPPAGARGAPAALTDLDADSSVPGPECTRPRRGWVGSFPRLLGLPAGLVPDRSQPAARLLAGAQVEGPVSRPLHSAGLGRSGTRAFLLRAPDLQPATPQGRAPSYAQVDAAPKGSLGSPQRPPSPSSSPMQAGSSRPRTSTPSTPAAPPRLRPATACLPLPLPLPLRLRPRRAGGAGTGVQARERGWRRRLCASALGGGGILDLPPLAIGCCGIRWYRADT